LADEKGIQLDLKGFEKKLDNLKVRPDFYYYLFLETDKRSGNTEHALRGKSAWG
jgi:hypothetical protein